MSGRRPSLRSRRRRSAATVVVLVLLLVVGLVAVALTAASSARADDTCTATWAGGVGSWDDATRWSPAGVPGPDDDVCIHQSAGGPATTVRTSSSVEVASVTLAGATLSLATGTTLSANRFTADRAGLTGGGTLSGPLETTAFTDTRLARVQVVVPCTLRLAGRITVAGGATVTQTEGCGLVDLLPGLLVVDGDGNPGNHLQFGRVTIYGRGEVFVGVRLALVDSVLMVLGDVTLAALDNLDADGWLRPAPRARTLTLDLAESSLGILHLPRTVTGIGRGVSVFAGPVDTGLGTDALSGLRTIDGSLGLDHPLYLDGPLTVRGQFLTSSTVSTTSVDVRQGASFAASGVAGALTSAGSCALFGARIDRLTLLLGSDTTTELTSPITVGGQASLAGSLTVRLGSRRLPVGTTLVLLTASRGVTGRFDAVRSDAPRRERVHPGYHPTWVTGLLTAPAD